MNRYPITKFTLAVLLGTLALWAAAQVRLPRPIPHPEPSAVVTPARPIPIPTVRAEIMDDHALPGPDSVLVGLLRHGIEPRDLDPDTLWEIDRLTAYNAVPDQTDDDPDIASCGPIANARLPILAVSRERFLAPDGSKPHCGREAVIIAWDASGQVVLQERRLIYDTMNERYERTADLHLPGDDPTEANQWGVKQGLIALVPQQRR